MDNPILTFLLFFLLTFSAAMLFFINITLSRILGTIEGHWR